MNVTTTKLRVGEGITKVSTFPKMSSFQQKITRRERNRKVRRIHSRETDKKNMSMQYVQRTKGNCIMEVKENMIISHQIENINKKLFFN